MPQCGVLTAALATLLLGVGARAADSTAPSFLFLLGDDIGWGDFSYNNGTANTPHIDAWVKRDGSVLLQDMHSGGTVCSPTRATVLTGRNHFRDCVDFVYDCSDPTECTPDFEFAPTGTFTVGEAVRASGQGYESFFTGKWHLGALKKNAPMWSSPQTHGFDGFNATVEVAPTSTTNCNCKQEWAKTCEYGHYGKPAHCNGRGNPGGGPSGCCFNYWWNDDSPSAGPWGISNLTWQTPEDDTEYVTDAFERFLQTRKGAPFAAQISFHNCHIPFIGSPQARADCASGKTCKPPTNGVPYTEAELDYYACLNELDSAIGRVMSTLDTYGYGQNTMTWMATDNGPEENCKPAGICRGTEHRPKQGPGSAGPLRGRKRDVWEGGHRVPGAVSWPAVINGPARVSWDTVVTMDFLATVMDVLNVQRPKVQQDWAFDGQSIMPILRGEAVAPRGIGWMFMRPNATAQMGYGYRYGQWKLAVGGKSCAQATCLQPQLYDLSTDLGERNNLASSHPEVLKAIMANFTAWQESITHSRQVEAKCTSSGQLSDAGDDAAGLFAAA